MKGPCPNNCGTTIRTMMEPQCPRCLIYFTEDHGRLVEDQYTTPAQEPSYMMPVPATLHAPNLCCGCGGAPTTEGLVEMSYTTAPGVISKQITYSVMVPLCAQCYSVQNNWTGNNRPAEIEFKGGELRLKVRSLIFQREFLRLNRLGKFRL